VRHQNVFVRSQIVFVRSQVVLVRSQNVSVRVHNVLVKSCNIFVRIIYWGARLSLPPIHFYLVTSYSFLFRVLNARHPLAPVAVGVGHQVPDTVRGRLQFELGKSNYRLWRKTQKCQKFATLSPEKYTGNFRISEKLLLNAARLGEDEFENEI
jgi:hypothetical protein